MASSQKSIGVVPSKNKASEGLEEEGHHDWGNSDRAVTAVGLGDEGDGNKASVHGPLAFLGNSVIDEAEVVEGRFGEFLQVGAAGVV